MIFHSSCLNSSIANSICLIALTVYLILLVKTSILQLMEGQTQNKTLEFFRDIEVGDLLLSKIIPEAIALFSLSQSGQTSSCHIMCGSPLRAQDQQENLILRPIGTRFMSAKIGHSPGSETRVPNLFQATVQVPSQTEYTEMKELPSETEKIEKKITVLDLPGYRMTADFYGMLGCGYFHYRAFSKTPKLKFILAFQEDDLRDSGENFKKTIFKFIKQFKNWDDNCQQICRATSFLVTKAGFNTDIDSLNTMILTLRNNVSGRRIRHIKRYQGLIDAVLKSDRLFLIKQHKNRLYSAMDDKIIQEVYDRSDFFQRKINGEGVQMKDIDFPVRQYIMNKLPQKDQLFIMDCQSFSKHIDQRLNNILKYSCKGSLINVIEALIEDAIHWGGEDQCLPLMKELVRTYYPLQDQYKKLREHEVNALMEHEQGKWIRSTNEQLDHKMRNNSFIKKFNVLKHLEQVCEEYIYSHHHCGKPYVDRSISRLQEISEIFIGFFRQLRTLRQTYLDKTIQKYSYILQRVIQEYRIVALLIQKEFYHTCFRLNIRTPSSDLFMIFQDEIVTRFDDKIHYGSLKEDFVKAVNISEIGDITQETIEFFEGIQNLQLQERIKITSIIIKYFHQLFYNDPIPSDDEKRFIGLKLFQKRNDFYSLFQSNFQEDTLTNDQKQQVVQTIVQLTNSLGFILKTLDSSCAIEVYKSINSAEQVISCYELALKDSRDKEQQKELLLSNAKDAKLFHQKQLALECYQRVYQLSSSQGEKELSNGLIAELKESKEEDITLQESFSQQFCSDFDQQLRARIQICLHI